jgi:ribosomal protein S18 acetylase RimI-like enzyme
MSPGPRRILAEAIRDLPDGLEARPVDPGDVPALTALQRATDIAGCGHTSTTSEEVRSDLANPECGWARGSAAVWRGRELVGALLVYDGLAQGRGWEFHVHAAPSEPTHRAIHDPLIRAGLAEGRSRWCLLDRDLEVADPLAKTGCYVGDGALRADLERHGFGEVRRFWRMRIAHSAANSPLRTPADPGGPVHPVGIPPGYRLRSFRDVEPEWRRLHEVICASFADHFDHTPVSYEEWREEHADGIGDPTQWVVAEHEDLIVGFALGSNRYASEAQGYVSSLGVLREHRGLGLARALLDSRFADDAGRGFRATLLHVDTESATGATRLYESAGMVADTEIVLLHRPLLAPPP